jgi:predicted double-glycine peptidase
MEPTIGWFVSIASLSTLAWAGGYYLGGRSAASARAVLIVGLACMGVWGWLAYHPAVAVKLIPLNVLTRIEGVGSVPFFMLLLGLAWSRASIPRQKRVITWAMMFGAVFFVNGGLWMLQSTPEQGFAATTTGQPVLQSQEYSCVPAACAQALDLLGLPTSEKRMANLTHTRPGTGSTTLRAMQGLTERLEGTGYKVELLQVKPKELHRLPFPLLTPLHYEATRLHMVTITGVGQQDVYVSDPIDGEVLIPWDTFETVFTGEVLVFVRQ